MGGGERERGEKEERERGIGSSPPYLSEHDYAPALSVI